MQMPAQMPMQVPVQQPMPYSYAPQYFGSPAVHSPDRDFLDFRFLAISPEIQRLLPSSLHHWITES